MFVRPVKMHMRVVRSLKAFWSIFDIPLQVDLRSDVLFHPSKASGVFQPGAE